MIFMYQLLVIKFAQGLVHYDMFLNYAFLRLGPKERLLFLCDLAEMILMMGLQNGDDKSAVQETGLRQPISIVKILQNKNSVERARQIGELPVQELEEALRLLVTLFRITYQRRYSKEKANSQSWWFWDLSNENNMTKLLKKFEGELDPRLLRRIWG